MVALIVAILAVVLILVGLFTALKWMLVIGAVLLVFNIIDYAVSGRNRR